MHCLELPTFNVVIAGGGGISQALLEALKQMPGLNKAIVLARNPPKHSDSDNVIYLTMDAEQPDSIVQAAKQTGEHVDRVHLLINTVGVLHDDTLRPEKSLKAVNQESLLRSFAINAAFLPLLAQAFSALMRHDEPAMLASLSARVGSIEDNQSGGWYSYRAAKAAQNMLLRTLAREWRLSHPRTTVLALHPGTVDTRLSQPFVTASYRKRVLTPDECAAALLKVMASLSTSDSGSFHDWQGESIPW
ncbi:MAG: SDR family NAD(P)-dependent oxidoreductase [Halioglobus sp.]